MSRIARHQLYVTDLKRSEAFYQDMLGMVSYGAGAMHKGQVESCVLGYPSDLGEGDRADMDQQPAMLELIWDPHRIDQLQAFWQQSRSAEASALKTDYWKIGITLADLDLAYRCLQAKKISVSQPRQFLDVGYLCHLQDPDGYTIELLQHRFQGNSLAIEPSMPGSSRGYTDQPITTGLGQPATLAHISLRVHDIEASLQFYQQQLGMHLLSSQIIGPFGFTLYFLSFVPYAEVQRFSTEQARREWLWQRPHTLLELQHYHHPNTLVSHPGFAGMGIKCDLKTTNLSLTLPDPDGYVIHLI